jgi:hypothetical protein
MIKVYELTPLGWQISHSTNNPSTTEYQIVYYLAKVRKATIDQIETSVGGNVGTALSKLLRGKIITDNSRG